MTQTEISAPPGVPQIVISREFAAPRDLLFRAHTDPALLVQWLGPRRLTMVVDHLDPRHGGTWRYIHREADGTEYAFRGVYHGTPSPDGIVQTFEYEGEPGHIALETLTLEERNGKTLLRQVSIYQSVAYRDAMVASGMAEGVNDSMERLDELMARLLAAH